MYLTFLALYFGQDVLECSVQRLIVFSVYILAVLDTTNLLFANCYFTVVDDNNFGSLPLCSNTILTSPVSNQLVQLYNIIFSIKRLEACVLHQCMHMGAELELY